MLNAAYVLIVLYIILYTFYFLFCVHVDKK